MPYWPPDTPPEVPPQMPQATTPGPAPVPYGGPGFAITPDMLAPQAHISLGYAPGADVLDGVTGANHVTEAPLTAPNVSPYEAGSLSPVYVGGDPDAGGRDDVAASVSGAVANAEARFIEHQSDTYGLGSNIGDLMSFPGLTTSGAPLDPGTAAGKTVPAGGFYDPPRNYGDA
jgi:hypothetical protein